VIDMKDESHTRLRHAVDREHILLGILKAQDDWEATLTSVAASEDDDMAIDAVASHLGLDRLQATAVLDMQFRRLSRQSRVRLADELASIREEIQRWSSPD
jgi:DNA gyrase subunit A